MLISDVIKKLQELENQYGDLNVVIQTTYYTIPIEAIQYSTDDENNKWMATLV
jgi:hypothetical protein